ncbi:MAG: glycosyltransferase family 9 protein [Verrucomicrobiota bacterium]
MTKRKILVFEFWGLGDLSFSTPVLKGALEAGCEVHLAGKHHARSLLAPTFPSIRFFSFDAPWSRFTSKYDLWRWNWTELFRLICELRKERYDAVVSVRSDPRDHLLMWLIGARERIGFPFREPNLFLTQPLTHSNPKQHKVEDWRDIKASLGLEVLGWSPELAHAAYRSPRIDALFSGIRKPVVGLHTGARIPVRRWPHFGDLIARLRKEFDFHLVLIPDPDGSGKELGPLADSVAADLSIPEMVDLLGRVDLLVCNDSGPSHLAAACGRPVIAVFGPSDPDWFRPWGDIHKVIVRDICPWRPCFDYCKFSEPYCMTKLDADQIWSELRAHILHLVSREMIPGGLIRK